MSFSEYLLGAAELALIAGALCFGAYYLRALMASSWSGAPARLGEAVLAISGLIVVSELVGVVGLFYPGVITAVSVVAGLGVGWAARRRVAGAPAPPAPPKSAINPWMTAIGVVIAGLVVVHWAIPTQIALDRGMYSQDTIWYHMSFAARFAQSAQVGPILITDPLKVVSWFYPQNSELLHGVGIAAFGHDNLSPLINIGWMALCLLAAWCIGRPYGVAPLTLAGVAIVLDTPMMVEQAGNAPSDTIALFFLLATVALLVNADAARRASGAAAAGESGEEGGAEPESAPGGAHEREGRRADSGSLFSPPRGALGGPVALAGIAAGLAVGTKITLLAAIGALTLALIYLAGRQARLRFTAIWVAALAIPSAFWYARNLIDAHNLLPWVHALGLPGPSQFNLYPRQPHTVAHYATNTGVWRHWFFPALDDRLGPLWVVLLIGCIGGLILLGVRGRSRMLRMLALVGLVAVAAYTLTPLSAAGSQGSPSGFAPNLRYFSPGFALGLALLPLAIPLATERRRQIAFGALAAALLVGAIVQIAFKPPAFSQAEITQIATQGQTGFRSFALKTYSADKLPGSLLLGAVLVLVPFGLSRIPKQGRARLAVAGGSAAVVILAIGVGWPQARDYVKSRYDTRLADPFRREAGFRASLEWAQIQQWGRNLTHKRIAVVGRASAFGQYVFYGPDLSNRVQYVAQLTPRGGSRPIQSCVPWRKALDAGNYDYVVITPRLGSPAFSTPPEIAWTSADPHVQLVVKAGPAAVFKLSGSLDPARCPPASPSSPATPAARPAIRR